jgi:hypothetical protein
VSRWLTPVHCQQNVKSYYKDYYCDDGCPRDGVRGTDRFCTDFMQILDGRMFGKVGAEVVYCIGDKEAGIGIAIKIEDGNERATYPVAVEVLNQLGLLSKLQKERLSSYHVRLERKSTELFNRAIFNMRRGLPLKSF